MLRQPIHADIKDSVRPRIFDYVVTDSGIEQLEVKGKRGILTVNWNDLVDQIDYIREYTKKKNKM